MCFFCYKLNFNNGLKIIRWPYEYLGVSYISAKLYPFLTAWRHTFHVHGICHDLLLGSWIFFQLKRVYLEIGRYPAFYCKNVFNSMPPSPQLIFMFAASHGKHLRKPPKKLHFQICFVNMAFSTWIKTTNVFVNISHLNLRNIVNIFIESSDESQGCLQDSV